FKPEVVEIITEIRVAAAKAGFYGMCAPKNIGGGGLGYLAWFAAWEKIYHFCGHKYWLGGSVISHWAMGPSPVLANMTTQAQEMILPDMMSGRKTMCFGLSEPGAGSDATMIKT